MIVVPLRYRDPLAVFQVFAGDSHAALLEQAEPENGSHRTLLAADPYRTITVTQGDLNFTSSTKPDPFRLLADELKQKGQAYPSSVRFSGGAIGYFGYELAHYLECLAAPADDLSVPLLSFGLYDTVAVFDHGSKSAWIASPTRAKAASLLERIASAPLHLPPLDWEATSAWHGEMTRRKAERMISKIIEDIYAGELFQVNFTQRFLARRPSGLTDFEIYRRLRALSPAPFASFLRCGDLSVASASPERFLRVDRDGHIEACPIKGTRPRALDPALDAGFAQALRASEKDRAENLMIVDLMRNDLARVCNTGSIHVPQLCHLESFASVHHLVSKIEGDLRPGITPIDVLRATFPGGSVTGAPKIRAMEIIREVEPSPRGVYCGCLGWIGFDGSMDMSMVIRTLTLTRDVILAQAGGGIVADSVPALEYDECMIKMAPLLAAVTGERDHHAVVKRQAAGC